MTDSELVDGAAKLLRALSSPKHWLSTSRLARKLGVAPDRLDAVLTAHGQHADWSVRYCYYPSRRSMERLWGHRSHVGRQARLPGPARTDAPDTGVIGPDSYDSWVFLSHNHRDADRVRQVAEVVRDCGLGAWTFQQGIEQGAPIVASVRQAIEDCEHFLLYLSPSSLRSVWIDKELHFGLSDQHPERHSIAVVDTAMPGFLEAITSAFERQLGLIQDILELADLQDQGRVARILQRLCGYRDRLRLVTFSGSDDSDLRAALRELAGGADH